MNYSNDDAIIGELRRITKLLVHITVKGQEPKDQVKTLDNIGFKSKEMADMLGINPSTVRTMLQKIRKKGGNVRE